MRPISNEVPELGHTLSRGLGQWDYHSGLSHEIWESKLLSFNQSYKK